MNTVIVSNFKIQQKFYQKKIMQFEKKVFNNAYIPMIKCLSSKLGKSL